MIFNSVLRKMYAEYQSPIRYYLNFNDDFIDVNQLISRKISIEHVGNQCKSCGLDKPIFRMGFCQSCFYTVPEASPSIINPELSMAHLGKEQRDLEWEKKFELQPHIVYLALSGGLKVGVTRGVQVPTRWIDQGASNAIILAETPNRYEAGMIEVLLKDSLADKTNWQRMLKNQNPEADLVQIKEEVREKLSDEQQRMYVEDNKIWEFEYPIEHYPSKVKSLTLAKHPKIEGVLAGIRGQYLYFESGEVFNVRNHEGHVVEFTV